MGLTCQHGHDAILSMDHGIWSQFGAAWADRVPFVRRQHTSLRFIISCVAKKRVFLDECVSDLGHVFGAKAHVYKARDLGVNGKEDTRVIETAFQLKCLIVTVNKDFLDYYYNHPRRKGKRGVYFYGLIFLKPSKRSD